MLKWEKEFCAKICHEANKAFCESIGDFSQLGWEDAPDWQKQSAINGVDFHLGNDTKASDSHVSWMKEKINDGWVYGEAKDAEKKTHPCIVPYEQLPIEQQSKDYIFKGIVDAFKKYRNDGMIINSSEIEWQ